MTLKFDGLANFTPTEKPEDFKVTVNKGTAVDDTSTLEITVKIVCGDNEASKTVAAEKGVAEFKINDFSKAKFTEVAKDASCKATATAEGATKGEESITATDKITPPATEFKVAANGLITVPSAGKVILKSMTGKTCAAHLVKWPSSNAVTTATVADTGGIDSGDLYLVGANAKANCEVTMAGNVKADVSAYAPTALAGVAKANGSADGKLNITHSTDKTFTWYVKSTADTPVTFTPSSGSVDGAAAEKDIPNMPANLANVEVWIKHSGGVQML